MLQKLERNTDSKEKWPAIIQMRSGKYEKQGRAVYTKYTEILYKGKDKAKRNIL